MLENASCFMTKFILIYLKLYNSTQFGIRTDDRNILSGFALFTPFRRYLVARNSTLLHANNKGADQPAHPRSQLALEDSTVRHACADPDNSNGGGICFSMEVRNLFLLGSK